MTDRGDKIEAKTPSNDQADAPRDGGPKFLDIDLGQRRRWRGLIVYLLFFLAVAAALMIVFVKVSGSIAMAAGLVIFMVAYMAISGWVASGKLDRRE